MDPLLTDDCDMKKSARVQIIMERTRDTVTEIFSNYKRKMGDGARQAVQLARNRHSDKLIIKPKCEFKVKGFRFFKNLGCEEVATGLLLLTILIMLLLTLYLVRNYNHMFVYGSGGCLTTFLWAYDDCLIIT
ncbi:uncharacterized protein LOC108087435 [Drosophila ficusphila]|uniref:uncharacterized protein LOC108087435 n=1 Tax=Drosophila ficusphila TaxID=30025 RepID=UPI0007E8AFCE|nr:uncharacterized protein LOC108087435 [Drosophila ficusphila]